MRHVFATPLPARDALLLVMAGIVADRCYGVPLELWGAIGIIAALVAIFKFFAKRESLAPLQIAALFLVIFSLAGLWHHLVYFRFSAQDIGFCAAPHGEPACVEGVVITMPRVLLSAQNASSVFSRSQRVVFQLAAKSAREGTQNKIPVTGKLLVIVDGGEQNAVAPGDSVRIIGELARPQPPHNRGDFHYADALRMQRILATMRVAHSEAVQIINRGDFSPQSGSFSWQRMISSMRQNALTRFEETMSPTSAALAAAMILGMREELADETRQQLLETGTVHLLAISGLHIGLVAALVGFSLALFRVPRAAMALIVFFVCLVYLAMTDVRPPAIRATVLVGVVMLTILLRRKTISVNTLAVTALVVLAINPTDLFQSGAQLSFIATACFLWLPTIPRFVPPVARSEFPILHSLFARIFFYVRIVMRLFLVSATIWIALSPLIATSFHLFTPVAMLVNPLLWIPLTWSLFFGMLLLLFGWISPFIALPLGWLASFGFAALHSLILFFHSLPYGAVWVPGIALPLLLLLYLPLGIATFFPQLRPSRRVFWSGILIWILIVIVTFFARVYERKIADRMSITVASVGHGLACVAISPAGKALVFDAGNISSPLHVANSISQELWLAGKRHIDTLVISHGDFDHYSALPILLERFSIGEVLVPPQMLEDIEEKDAALANLFALFARYKINVRGVKRGDTLKDFDATFLHPSEETSEVKYTSRNAGSLVLLIEHRGKRVLLTGDLDLRTPLFTQEENTKEIPTKHFSLDAMLLPHHGGRSASFDALVVWGKPQALIVSGGRLVRNQEYLDDLTKRGYNLYDTFIGGAVTITQDVRGFEIKYFVTKEKP